MPVVLSRNNETVGELRRLSGGGQADPWPAFEEADGNRERLFHEIVSAGELACQGHYELAIRTLLRGIRIRRGEFLGPIAYAGQATDLERRALAVGVLEFLVTHYDELVEDTLMSAYARMTHVISQTVPGSRLRGVRRGRFKSFAESTAYRDLAGSVRLVEETRTVRTIHKAKGDEFNSVLVVLTDEEQLTRVLRPDEVPEREKEERRITYVGLSRARECLMIAVPCISHQNMAELVTMGAEVVKCGGCLGCAAITGEPRLRPETSGRNGETGGVFRG